MALASKIALLEPWNDDAYKVHESSQSVMKLCTGNDFIAARMFDGSLRVMVSESKRAHESVFDDVSHFASYRKRLCFVTKDNDLRLSNSRPMAYYTYPLKGYLRMEDGTPLKQINVKDIAMNKNVHILLESGELFVFNISLGTCERIRVSLQKDSQPSEAEASTSSATTEDRIISICASETHLAGVTQQGKVFCWGSNSYGQCGQPMCYTKIDTPTLVSELSDIRIVQVAVGRNFSLAVSEEGSVYFWGGLTFDMLGRPESEPITKESDPKQLPPWVMLPHPNVPRKIKLPNDNKVKSVSCGADHFTIMTFDQRVLVYGSNNEYQAHKRNRKLSRFLPISINKIPARSFRCKDQSLTSMETPVAWLQNVKAGHRNTVFVCRIACEVQSALSDSTSFHAAMLSLLKDTESMNVTLLITRESEQSAASSNSSGREGNEDVIVAECQAHAFVLFARSKVLRQMMIDQINAKIAVGDSQLFPLVIRLSERTAQLSGSNVTQATLRLQRLMRYIYTPDQFGMPFGNHLEISLDLEADMQAFFSTYCQQQQQEYPWLFDMRIQLAPNAASDTGNSQQAAEEGLNSVFVNRAFVTARSQYLSALLRFQASALADSNNRDDAGDGLPSLTLSEDAHQQFSPRIISLLLEYIYSNNTTPAPEEAIELLVAAHEMNEPQLMVRCAQCIFEWIDVNNVIDVWQLACRLEFGLLQEFCADFINTSFHIVVRSDAYIALLPEQKQDIQAIISC